VTAGSEDAASGQVRQPDDSTAEQIGDVAEQVGDSAVLEAVARVGLVAYGVVYLLIGWLALRIAWGAGGDSADTSGAMATLAEQPLGKVLLWLVAVGLTALALWQLSAAAWGRPPGRRPARVRARLTHVGSAMVYAALGVTAVRVALGSRTSSTQTQQHATSGVLAWPGGRVVVVAAGLVVLAAGVASIARGVRGSFSDEISTSLMSASAGESVRRLGQVGYIAKGLALGVVGSLLSYATVTVESQNAQGLDGAMQTILAQPFGRYLLSAVALGFFAFGLFVLLQVRYRRM
jgi:hypothetical protein